MAALVPPQEPEMLVRSNAMSKRGRRASTTEASCANLVADVNVFDSEHSAGFRATLAQGEVVTLLDGEPTGARLRRLIRRPLAA
jgi:hypothetical protein